MKNEHCQDQWGVKLLSPAIKQATKDKPKNQGYGQTGSQVRGKLCFLNVTFFKKSMCIATLQHYTILFNHSSQKFSFS